MAATEASAGAPGGAGAGGAMHYMHWNRSKISSSFANGISADTIESQLKNNNAHLICDFTTFLCLALADCGYYNNTDSQFPRGKKTYSRTIIYHIAETRLAGGYPAFGSYIEPYLAVWPS
jgi:hypothetical protein